MTHLADPRIIGQMPLHEITARHGERGLHQGLAIVAAKFAEAADRRRVPDRSSGQTASARADGEAALSVEQRSRELVELRGFEPLTFCMPCNFRKSGMVWRSRAASISPA